MDTAAQQIDSGGAPPPTEPTGEKRGITLFSLEKRVSPRLFEKGFSSTKRGFSLVDKNVTIFLGKFS